MSGPELFALLPVLILAGGSIVWLMLGAFGLGYRTIVIGGVFSAATVALCAGLLPPATVEVTGLFGTGSYARFFTILWALAAALTLLLSLRYGANRHFGGGEYTALTLLAATGMALLSGATSLVGVFLGLELLSLAFYVLIAFNRDSAHSAEACIKYLVLGSVATAFLAFGIALIYAASGSFHLPEALAGVVSNGALHPLGLFGWLLVTVAVGFKTSLVPFHFWTPDVYQGAPAPVSGFLAAGSKGAVLAALVPLLAGFGPDWALLHPLVVGLTALTLIVGSLCALAQTNLKRMLAYSSIVQVGYLFIGFLAGNSGGFEAVVFYLVVYAVVTLGTFGVITSLSGSRAEVQDYDSLRGVGFRHPFRAATLTILLLSLAGIPATAGFIAKFGIFRAAIKGDFIGLTLLAVIASLVSLYYYLRPVLVMFTENNAEGNTLHPGNELEHAVLGVCLLATLLLGLYPGPLLDLIHGLF
ncbi:MAG: NADH-quinone oxidoreductase subunit N [Desulfuromonadales bacterium]|nr:NADH-quinone oxidoreductase subunit N [Desulfuromonadales bacterium]